jgi:hypothetical protein
VEAAELGQLEGAQWWRRRLVVDGGSGEVLQLGGYTGVRPEPKAEEKHGCEADRGGKHRRRFCAMASDRGGGVGGRWGS